MVHRVVTTFGGVCSEPTWGGRGGIGFLGQNIKKCQLDSYQNKVVRGGGGVLLDTIWGGVKNSKFLVKFDPSRQIRRGYRIYTLWIHDTYRFLTGYCLKMFFTFIIHIIYRWICAALGALRLQASSYFLIYEGVTFMGGINLYHIKVANIGIPSQYHSRWFKVVIGHI